MNDTQRARQSASHLSEALDHLAEASKCIRNARDAYPDEYAAELYNRVLNNAAIVEGYVRMLRVPAQAYAGDVDGLKEGASHVRTGR